MIDLLIVATRRPEILERTLNSFTRNLFRNFPVRIIINIDPVGPGSSMDVLKVAESYFKVKRVNFPVVAGFPAAFKWVWEQADADICFWLEDDWELVRPISLTDMIEVLFYTPRLAALRLNWKHTGKHLMKNWKFKFLWEPIQVTSGWSGFFECPAGDRQEVGFCGHPSLIRGEYIRKCGKLIDINLNPEKQFHRGNEKLIKEVLKWRYGVYGGREQPHSIIDIGREWMIQNGFRKAENKAWFCTWNEADK